MTSGRIRKSSKLISGPPEVLIELIDIRVSFGKVVALREVSMAMPDGSINTIIGANGAGKSTTLRAISGLTPLSKGEIRFQGERIDGLIPDKVVARASPMCRKGGACFRL